MKKLLTAAAVLAIALGGVWLYSGMRSDTAGADPFRLEAQESTDEVDLSLVQEMSMGNPDAEVTVIEYASFTCPHCKTFHSGPLKEIKANYIDTGKINFVFREVYFDRYGLWAGMVARCAGPLRYFGLTDLIFQNQADWTKGEPAAVAANLRRLGKTAGLSDDQLDTCMQDADKARAMVATWEKNGEEDEINSTPSFVINGEKFSNMSYADFAKTLDEKLSD